MAASGTGSRAGLGWLVLAAALAVPGFLFFNWWSHMKAERDRSVAAKARGRLPDGAVFQTAPGTAKPADRVASSSAPAAPPAAPAPAPAPPPEASPAPSAVAEDPPPAATPSPEAAAGIVLPRDPMLSPMDIVRIREEEMARERSRLELEEANRRRNSYRPVKRVAPPIETRVELMGTVATPNGASLAIVNNATLAPGESFSVAGYAGKVRVVRISAAGVTFEYKKRTFKKSVNPE